jgi:hypothetical protein
MGPPKPKGPSTTDRVWQSLQEAWEELKDTATGYQIFR